MEISRRNIEFILEHQKDSAAELAKVPAAMSGGAGARRRSLKFSATICWPLRFGSWVQRAGIQRLFGQHWPGREQFPAGTDSAVPRVMNASPRCTRRRKRPQKAAGGRPARAEVREKESEKRRQKPREALNERRNRAGLTADRYGNGSVRTRQRGAGRSAACRAELRYDEEYKCDELLQSERRNGARSARNS